MRYLAICLLYLLVAERPSRFLQHTTMVNICMSPESRSTILNQQHSTKRDRTQTKTWRFIGLLWIHGTKTVFGCHMVSYIDLPANLRTHQNTTSFLDRFKVVAGNLPHAQTIVAHIARDGHYFIHPDIEQNRSITPREAARIQTFPDNYYFESKKGIPSRTLAFKQIGNAGPVCLAYHVAMALLDRFDEQN